MKQKWIGTGWEMNLVLVQAQFYLSQLRGFFAQNRNALPTVFLVPPFTVLRDVCSAAAGLPILVGAQNMHWQPSGSFTGAVSSRMVKECGAHLVELGHSDRRSMFGETDLTEVITDRKKAEAEKAKLEGRLRQAQKIDAIGTLAGGIAQDFS